MTTDLDKECWCYKQRKSDTWFTALHINDIVDSDLSKAARDLGSSKNIEAWVVGQRIYTYGSHHPEHMFMGKWFRTYEFRVPTFLADH